MREPLAVPTVPVAFGLMADGHQGVTWTCPACEARHVDDHEVAESDVLAVRCCACGADFVSVEDPEDARAVELELLPKLPK